MLSRLLPSALALTLITTAAIPASADDTRALRNTATLRHARQVIASISRHARVVQHELRWARTRGDAVDAACLSDKLSEIHAQERLANLRRDELASALAEGDNQRLLHGRVVLGLLRDRARKLARDAAECGRFGAVPQNGYTVRILAPSAS